MNQVLPLERPPLTAHPFQRILQIPDRETDLSRRGVTLHDLKRAAELREKARRFVAGCNAMFGPHPFDTLAQAFTKTRPDERGFLIEGAAMGAVIRDGLSLRSSFLAGLFADYGARYEYLLTVGVGWGLARMPWRARAALCGIAPEIQPLAADGRGFHDLFFSPGKSAGGRIAIKGAQGTAYDAGLGRSIWFVASGVPQTAGDLIDDFDVARRGDLLSGLGLAMAYAGPTVAEDWDHIITRYPAHRAHLLQGVSFGFEAHRRAGIHTPMMDVTANALGLTSVDAAANVSSETRPLAANLSGSPAERYARWRTLICARFNV